MKRAVVAAVLLLCAGRSAWAQGFRIGGVSTAQYIDVRPLVLDSMPASQVTGEGVLKQTAEGVLVTCSATDAFCRFTRAAPVMGALPLTQDLEVSAWGLTTGLRAYAQLRARASAGDADRFWPTADRRFEALAAYLELDRGAVLARVGRQWKTSGLGFYNFDGGLLGLRPWSWLTLEAYGGRSLVRGMNQPLTGTALAAIEPWAPDQPDWLVGADLRWRPTPFLSAGVLYQRDARTDAAGLYGERVAADARLRLGASSITGALQADLASGDVNEGRLRLDLPRLHAIAPSLEARHYQPYFQLWTIWGAFAPVGYDEATASALWGDPSGRVALQASGGYRRYGDRSGGMVSLPLRNDGWRVGTDLTYRPDVLWTLSAGYSADVGFGASRSDQTLGVRRQLGAGYLGLTGMAFQTLDEFRVERGRVWGLGADGGFRLGADARLDGSFQMYRHAERYAGGIDWNQLRGTVRLEWTVGPEPGRRAAPGGAR